MVLVFRDLKSFLKIFFYFFKVFLSNILKIVLNKENRIENRESREIIDNVREKREE